jgi:glycosyltransferase involved in cell wall biosynthesis
MKEASVFLLPTRIDTGPTALKEALAMGLWPVCYDNSGPAEYIRLFGFGTLAKDGDLADLTERLTIVLRNRPWEDPAKRVQLRELTQKRFSRQNIWMELVRLYQDVSRTEG